MLLPQKILCLKPRELDESFGNSESKAESLIRLGCVQGLGYSGLLNLMSF